MLTESKIKLLFPTCKNSLELTVTLNECMPRYGITSPNAIRFFLAQYAQETGGFVKFVENTNYTSPERLLEIFPKYFKTLEFARKYVGKPEAIANRVYGSRFGNGDELSGDGYRYRGRGICHLTFKDNYEVFKKDTGIDVITHPELLEQVKYAVEAGCHYWKKRNISVVADKGDFIATTKLINGGIIGLPQRQAWLTKVKQVLGQ